MGLVGRVSCWERRNLGIPDYRKYSDFLLLLSTMVCACFYPFVSLDSFFFFIHVKLSEPLFHKKEEEEDEKRKSPPPTCTTHPNY